MAFNKACTIAHHDPVSPYIPLFSGSHLLYDLGHGTWHVLDFLFIATKEKYQSNFYKSFSKTPSSLSGFLSLFPNPQIIFNCLMWENAS